MTNPEIYDAVKSLYDNGELHTYICVTCVHHPYKFVMLEWSNEQHISVVTK